MTSVEPGLVVPLWVQRWFDWPLQVQMIALVPLAVAPPLTSRHSPDCWPTSEPLLPHDHFWFVWPLQVQMRTAVPAVVPLWSTSRHIVLPNVRSSPADVSTQPWLLWLLQSQMSTAVPAVLTLPATSRHLPEAALTSAGSAAKAGPAPIVDVSDAPMTAAIVIARNLDRRPRLCRSRTRAFRLGLPSAAGHPRGLQRPADAADPMNVMTCELHCSSPGRWILQTLVSAC